MAFFRSTSRTTRRRPRSVALLGAAALVLAGCSAPSQDSAGDVPAELKDYYGQQLEWQPCESGMECTTVKVPLDWDKPTDESVELAVVKLKATGEKKGSILVNPGGPGGSGYSWVVGSASETMSSKLRRSYDAVGFDPRGVGRSTPIECLTDVDHDQFRSSTTDTDTDAGLQALREEYSKLAAACQKNSGPVLGEMDTKSAARDMDVLRALMGDEKLNYLGFSYGTHLGSAYAELYPQKVGRFVLDGAVDPSKTYFEITKGQAVGFEKAFKAYLDNCLSQVPCGLKADDDPATADDILAKVRQLLETNRANPGKTTDGRTVPSSMLVSGILVPLYNNLAWPALTQGLAEAFNGNFDRLVTFADASATRQENGKYATNSDFAFMAVNCLDYTIPADTATLRAEQQELMGLSPTFGRYLANGGAICENWPHKSTRTPAPAKAPGAAPMLVIGTTGDPSTPLENATALTSQLTGSRMLTWKGDGHTAYGRSNQCVRDAVDTFYLEGKLPAEGAVC